MMQFNQADQAADIDIAMCTDDTGSSSSGSGGMDVEMGMEVEMEMDCGAPPYQKQWVGGIGWM
jgi:hypothetical protein